MATKASINGAFAVLALVVDRPTQRSFGDARIKWFHVNFADAVLFGFYGGSLLAQDELQVLELPLLACVREHLVGDATTADEARTVDRQAHRKMSLF